jgi:hypothetical protein
MTDRQNTWCQPGDQQRRQFIVLFDDTEQQMAVFDDEDEARAYWKEASIDWNCYLFGAMPKKPDVPLAEPEATETFRENRNAVSELCGLHERLLRSIDDKIGFEMIWANELSKIADTVLDAATRLDRANRQLQSAHYRKHEIRHPSVNIVGAVWMAMMGCPHSETEDELTMKFDPDQYGATVGSQLTHRVARELGKYVIQYPSEADQDEKVAAETLMRVAEELGLDHATAYNCIDAIRILKASVIQPRTRRTEPMTDHDKLLQTLSTAEARLESQLNGIRHASATPIVRGIKDLIDAKIALASASPASASPASTASEDKYRNALVELAAACTGEVEEVFRGELGEAMSKARKALRNDFLQDLG